MDGKSQVHAIRPDGGEAVVLSRHDAAVGNHEWSPDGTMIVFAAPEGDDAADKARKDALGEFTVVRRDYQYAQLWTLPVADAPQHLSSQLLRKGTQYMAAVAQQRQ